MIISHNARARVPSLGYVCPSCRLAQRRSISTAFLQRKEEGRMLWDKQAESIKAGKQPSPLKILEDRGFVNQIAGNRDSLNKLMIEKRIGVYCGIDPTAPSLHVGHMIPLMALFWMHCMGFHAVSLIGAATAKIGDPTGRSKDRPEMTSTERKANIVGIHYQLKRMWSNLEGTAHRHGYEWDRHWHRELVNNAVWWNKVPFIDVLKYLGKGLRMNEMLRKETVKQKMKGSADGMSFAEFSYPIMQAWDWWHMYDTKDVQMQIGGADQFGNIVAGIDAVKYMATSHPDPDIRQEGGVSPRTTPYGLTVPLLTTADGKKFGKSAGNAVWLDENMTELWHLYAYFIKTADTDVERYLKMFTFLPLDSIAKTMQEHQQDTSKQVAQKLLAYEFCHLVHGPDKAEKAKARYENLSAARKSTSLETLLSVSPDEELASHYAREIAPAPATGENKLTAHVLKSEQQRGTFVSPKLNPYAPPADPNKPSGAAMHIILPKSLVYGQSVAKVLYSAGLVSSRSEGHRLAQAQGAYLGRKSDGRKQMTEDLQFIPAKLTDPDMTWSFVIRDHASGAMDKPGEEGLLILRTGKWKTRIVRVVSDERFHELGLPYPPGWQEMLSVQAAMRAQLELDKGFKPAGHTAGPPPPEDRPLAPDEPFIEPSEHYSRHEKNRARHEQMQRGWAFFNRLQNLPADADNGRPPQGSSMDRHTEPDYERFALDMPRPPGVTWEPVLSRDASEPPKAPFFPWEVKRDLASMQDKRKPIPVDVRRELARNERNMAEGRFADEAPSKDDYSYDNYDPDEYRYERGVYKAPPSQDNGKARDNAPPAEGPLWRKVGSRDISLSHDGEAQPLSDDPQLHNKGEEGEGEPSTDDSLLRDGGEAEEDESFNDDPRLPDDPVEREQYLRKAKEREDRVALHKERKRLIQNLKESKTRAQGLTQFEKASWWRSPREGPGSRKSKNL